MFEIGISMPDTCKIIFPTAPERPVSANKGKVSTSWYDISANTGEMMKELDYNNLDDFLSKAFGQEELAESVAQIS